MTILNIKFRIFEILVKQITGLSILGFYCFFAFILGPDFAKLHVSLPFLKFPIFIGEMVMLLCLGVCGRYIYTKKIRLTRPQCFFLGYLGFIALWAVVECIRPGGSSLALRNALMFFYPIFAFFAYFFYAPAVFSRKSVQIFLAILLWLSCIISSLGYPRFIYFILFVVVLYAGAEQPWRYRVMVATLFLWPYGYFFSGERTWLVASVLTGLFLIFLFVTYFLKLKTLWKLLAGFTAGAVFLWAGFHFSDKAGLKTLFTPMRIIKGYKEVNATIQKKEFLFHSGKLPRFDIYSLWVRKSQSHSPGAGIGLYKTQEDNQETSGNIISNFGQSLPEKFLDFPRETFLNIIFNFAKSLSEKLTAVLREIGHLVQVAQKPELLAQVTQKPELPAQVTQKPELPTQVTQKPELPTQVIQKPELPAQDQGPPPGFYKTHFGQGLSEQFIPVPQETLLNTISNFAQSLLAKVTPAPRKVEPPVVQVPQKPDVPVQAAEKPGSPVVKVAENQEPPHRDVQSAYNNITFRLLIWRDMIRELWAGKSIFGVGLAHPQRSPSLEILGWGYGEWSGVGWITPHNSFLHLIYRAGIFGIGIIWVIFVILRGLIRDFIAQRSVIGVLLCGIIIYALIAANFFLILELPYYAIPFWSIFGLTMAYRRGLPADKR